MDSPKAWNKKKWAPHGVQGPGQYLWVPRALVHMAGLLGAFQAQGNRQVKREDGGSSTSALRAGS